MVYNFLRLSFLLVSTALAVILPSTDSNFTTDVLHHKRRDLDGLDQSMTVLSLEADIEGINSTHVRIIIVNTYSSDIAILVWNSVFDQGMADYSSFQVVPTGMQNAMPLSPGYGTVVKQYRRPTARSFLNIRARDRFTKDIDLTTRFLVPKADSYQVSFQDTFRAVLLADASATQLLSSAALRGFPTLLIGSHRPLIFLDPPPSIASLKRQASSPGTCQSPYRDVVRTARIRAQQLARSAREATDSSTWIEYFNGVQEVQNMVHQVFDGVMYFLHPKTYGISIRCETHVNRQQTCEQDVLAYHERQESGFALIVFCLYFFQIPAIDECSIPSERPYMVDQAGTYLHELTHNTMLTGGIEIKDGLLDDCHSWYCVEEAARLRNGSRYDGLPSPQHWAPSGLPEYIAESYTMYAYATRALYSFGCRTGYTNPYCELDSTGVCESGCECQRKLVTNPPVMFGTALLAKLGVCLKKMTKDGEI